MPNTESRDIPAWIALNRAELPPRLAIELLERFGSPAAIFSASALEIASAANLTPTMLSRLLSQQPDESGTRDWAALQTLGGSVVTLRDTSYPPLLRHIYDPPPLLYVRGQLLEQDQQAVAIVGSRRCSPYGRLVAHSLARDLAARGITIVSGLAMGIDGAAHQGALEAGGRTIGVIACGLDIPYPSQHAELKEKIIQQGAIVCEVPLGTPPTPARFPVRNRIISGLSLGVVVVEAPEKSGALITAHQAADQGREVFAVPGSVNSFHSRGCHNLLRDGAKLVETVDDILEELSLTLASPVGRDLPIPPQSAGMVMPALHQPQDSNAASDKLSRSKPRQRPSDRTRAKASSASIEGSSPSSFIIQPVAPSPAGEERSRVHPLPEAPPLPAGLTAEEGRLLASLSLQQKYVDEIIRETALPSSEVSAGLMLLELKGLVRRLPGNLFVRVK